MKIKPIDTVEMGRSDQAKPMQKSRLKRLFERQFPGVLRISSAERLAGGADLEPSSVCLDKMVRNFMEDNVEKSSSSRCGRSRCNCFHGNCDDSSDEDLDFLSNSNSSYSNISAAEVVKGLVVFASVPERNLLAEASSIVDKVKHCKRKDEHIKAVADGLQSLGYDASICKSRWEKTPSFPAGEHKYIDVIIGSERLVVDVDFRSEFQIARPTKSYAAVLQSLPSIFVGKADRVGKIVAIVSEAARLSLKKKGLDFPPWRKPEYMCCKWLAPHERSDPAADSELANVEDGNGDTDVNASSENACSVAATGEPRELEGKNAVVDATPAWQPPEVKPKVVREGTRLVAGLASMLSEKP